MVHEMSAKAEAAEKKEIFPARRTASAKKVIAQYNGPQFHQSTDKVKIEKRPTVSQYLNELPG